jgi:hypothetical protein
MAYLAPLGKKGLPPAPPLRRLIGPSFIILGVGLGSGELILWPYLASNYGLGLIWAAVIGITFQFFINMEIERYTIVTGESIFVGLMRKFGRFSPIWFIFSTFLPWMWPGIAAASATVLASALGIQYSGYLGIMMLLGMGVMYSLGKVVYKTQENVQKAIILIGVPFIFLITVYFARGVHWQALGSGIIGRGDGFWFLPAGLPFATFLAAFAYAGAGGNLNLAQSLYAKEKGYGMGKYSGRITNIFQGANERVTLEGSTFETNSENLLRFRQWWKRINVEHAIVFWFTGALTMILLSLLAFATVHKVSGVETSINFVIQEAGVIGTKTNDIFRIIFLGLASLMLFGTQFSVIGSNSRIMSENLAILNQKRFKVEKLSIFFYIFLWVQILAGVVIFALGFTEPLNLVIIGAVLNAISMFIYSGMILILNHNLLQTPLRPSILRTVIITLAFLFYGGFTVFIILQRIKLI